MVSRMEMIIILCALTFIPTLRPKTEWIRLTEI